MGLTIIWVIVFYLLLIDSIGANIVSWFGLEKWWKGNFRLFSRYFPVAKGWTILYLALVLFIGYIIHNFVTPLL